MRGEELAESGGSHGERGGEKWGNERRFRKSDGGEVGEIIGG